MGYDYKKFQIVQRYLMGNNISQISLAEHVNPRIVECVIKKYQQFPHTITKKCNCLYLNSK